MLVIVSNDYWGERAATICADAGVPVAVDMSSSPMRAIKLVARGSIPVVAAAQMFFAERQRPSRKPDTGLTIGSNPELRQMTEKYGAQTVVLFRAGLIISGKTIETVRVLNIHCAKIPEFGGLASIYRALRAESYEQCATLHVVTSRIDQGEVVATEPYTMARGASYAENESAAYEAGLRLLAATVTHPPQ